MSQAGKVVWEHQGRDDVAGERRKSAPSGSFWRRAVETELYTFGRVRLDTATVPGSPAQPKRLALLTYLLVATPRAPRRRDALLALFWPELGEAEARRALRQALTYLRHTVGDDLIGVLACGAPAAPIVFPRLMSSEARKQVVRRK